MPILPYFDKFLSQTRNAILLFWNKPDISLRHLRHFRFNQSILVRDNDDPIITSSQAERIPKLLINWVN